MAMNRGALILIKLLLLAACTEINGQVIQVLSATEKQAISNAHVLVKDNESGETALFITGTDGKAIVVKSNQVRGALAITISHLGYHAMTVERTTLTSETYLLEPLQNEIAEVVVTAQYKPDSRQSAVHNIRVINADKIQSSGAVNLSDALRSEANLRISQDNILGSGISMQGLSGQGIKILIDGVPVIGRLNGQIDLSQISVLNAERIEIIEGPLSVNFGADALAGTINIITRKDQTKNADLALNTYYESIGQYNVLGRVGIRRNKLIIQIQVGRNYFDGWRQFDKAFLTERVRIADSTRWMNWKPREQLFTRLRYSFYPGLWAFTVDHDYFDETLINKGQPRSPYGEIAFDEKYYTKRFSNSLQANTHFGTSSKVQVTAGYNYYQRIRNTWFKDLTTLEEILTKNENDQDTTDLDAAMCRATYTNSRDSSKVSYEIGADVNTEHINSKRILNTSQRISDFAAFASSELNFLDHLIIRPGIRLGYNTTFPTPPTPSLNLRYQRSRADRIADFTVFRTSVARGYRAPSLKELYLYFVDFNHNITGNNALKPESSWNISASISHKKTFKKFSMEPDVSLFYNHIKNLITLAQISGTSYVYTNLDLMTTTGLKTSISTSFCNSSASVGFTYTGREFILPGEHSKLPMTYSPEFTSQLSYNVKKYAISAMMLYKYTGAVTTFFADESGNVMQSKVHDYRILDLSVSKSFFNNFFDIVTGVKNLLNVTYVNGGGSGNAHSNSGGTVSVGTGRSYFIRLDFHLNRDL